MRYELDFAIGNISCMIVDIQPYNTENERQGKYYEHYHPCFEIHYIEEGEATFLCGKGTVAVTGGNLLIIPPRMFHKEISSLPETTKMALTLDVSAPSKTASESDGYFYSAFPRTDILSIYVNNTSLKQSLLQLKKLSATSEVDFATREKIRAIAHSFTVDLYDLLSKDAPKDTATLKDTAVTREYEIDTFMALNFMSNDSRDKLAAKLHVSPRQLHRIIKKSYGKTYREKLSEIRLEIAISFLETTDKSIADIAEELGYSTNASFTAFIKNSTGKTPREIRQTKKSANE